MANITNNPAFSRRPDVDGIWTDIQDGIISKLSMVM